MMADRVTLLGELAQPHRIPYQFGSRLRSNVAFPEGICGPVRLCSRLSLFKQPPSARGAGLCSSPHQYQLGRPPLF
jgi:hypothetical protein